VEDTAGVRDAVLATRTAPGPFDIAVPGDTEPDDDRRHDLRRAHAAAGATWWVEGVHPWRYGWDGDPGRWPTAEMHARITAGP
jgi:hypothetical protein